MKWLEIIEIQSIDCNQELFGSQLQKVINEVEMETNKQTVIGYRHAIIDNNFSIHLIHDSKEVEKHGSKLSIRLATILKEIGLVNHSIWIEMHSN
ncbi:hypothetical protein ACFL6H_08665 [Candidatus Latescibacterota bacterium]